MKCPVCSKEVSAFYDHVCEVHGWDMARAEHYADAVASSFNQGERGQKMISEPCKPLFFGLIQTHKWSQFHRQRVCCKCGKLEKLEWHDSDGPLDDYGDFWYDNGYIDNPYELVTHWKQLNLEEEQENKPKPIQYKHWGEIDQLREIAEASTKNGERRTDP